MTPEQVEFIRSFNSATELVRVFKKALDAEKVRKGDWAEWVRVWKGPGGRPPTARSRMEEMAREVFNIKERNGTESN